jgi:hypothetical protein
MKTNALKTETTESRAPAGLLSQEERRRPDRFFRISKVVGSLQMLDGWCEWFKLRNIPCAITKGNGGYTLWRGGEEIGGGESLALSALRKKTIVYSFGLLSADEPDASAV